MMRSYVRISNEVEQSISCSDIDNILNLIDSVAGLATGKPTGEVINEISFDEARDGNKVMVTVDVFPRYRPLIFGRKFTNVSCLRKLVSNATGRSGVYFQLEMVE